MADVLGIDASWSCTGVFKSRDTDFEEHYATVATEKKGFAHQYARLEHIVEQVTGHWGQPDTIVVLEGYSFGSKNNREMMGELGGYLRLRLLKLGVRLYICPPSVLKSIATGKGNSNKQAVTLGVFKKWGFEHTNDNVVDAFVLMKIGEMIRDGKDTAEFKKLVSKMEFIDGRLANS